MKKPLSNGELITFCEQLAVILHAGISVLEGISIMKEEADSAEGEAILGKIYDSIIENGFLYLALSEAEVFPEYMIQMVRLGEMSGRLDQVMEALARQYGREEAIRENIKGAVLYPSVMFGILIVIILVLVIEVMPVFSQVFAQMGSEMTGISAVILKAGQAMRRDSYLLIAVFLFLVAMLLYLNYSKKGKQVRSSFTQSFFATRELSEASAASRFAGGVSMCLRSGLNMEESLSMAGSLIDHKKLKAKIALCKEKMNEGEHFETALRETGIFKGIYGQMILIGYRAGSAEESIERVADLYEEEVDRKLQGLLSILEPSMIALLSVIVGGILLSVMLPLMTAMSGIGGGL